MEKALNKDDEFRTGIFLQVDFYQILWGGYIYYGTWYFFWKQVSK